MSTQQNTPTKLKNFVVLANGLERAILELGVHMDKEKADNLRVSMDLEGRGGLDFEEFKQAILQPPTEVEQWICTLPLSGLLTSCLPVHNCKGDQPLRNFSTLDVATLDAVVEAFSGAARLLLAEAQTRLKAMFAELDAKAAAGASDASGGAPCVSSKFSTFDTDTGDAEDYHAGLASRIGEPFLRRPHSLARLKRPAARVNRAFSPA